MKNSKTTSAKRNRQNAEFDQRPLPLNKEISRKIAGAEPHFYAVELSKGEVLRVTAEERNIDIALFLLRVSDEELLAELNFSYEFGRETLTHIIEESDSYIVGVGTLDSAKGGRYKLLARVKDSADADDTLRFEAERQLAQILVVFNEDTPENIGWLIENCERILPLWQKLKDPYWEAYVRTMIGFLYSHAGENRKALKFYHQAIPLLQKSGAGFEMGKLFHNLGSIYLELNQKRRAFNYFHKAQPLIEKAGDINGQANLYQSLGNLHSDLGKPNEAWAFYQKAFELFRKNKDFDDAGGLLNNFALVYSTLGEKNAAIKLFQQSLRLKQVGDNVKEKATTLGNIAGIYEDSGEFKQALELYEQALGLNRMVNDTDGESVTLNNIGLIHASLGEKNTALDYFFESLSLIEETGKKEAPGTTYNNIGNAYYSLGDTKEALKYYRQSLRISRKTGNKQSEAITLGNIGLAYSELGQTYRALEFLNRTFVLNRQVGDRGTQPTTLANIGSLYEELGDIKRSLKFYFQALIAARAVDDYVGEAFILGELMRIHESNNKPLLAIFFGKQAIKIFQKLRGKIQLLDKTLQQRYLNTIEASFRSLAELLLETKRLSEAHQILNLFKDQSFYDRSLKKSPTEIPPRTLSNIILTEGETSVETEFQRLLGSLASITKRMGRMERRKHFKALTEKERNDERLLLSGFKGVSSQFERFMRSLVTNCDRIFAGDIEHQLLSRDTLVLQSLLKGFEKRRGIETVAIYTLFSEKKFWTLLVTGENLEATSHTIKSYVLHDKILEFLTLLKSPKSLPQPLAEELYRIIFGQFEERLSKSVKVIMWSLDGVARYIPVAALHDGSQYLVERFNNVVFTRIDRKRLSQISKKPWNGVGFGNERVSQVGDLYFSELPGVKRELHSIANDHSGMAGVNVKHIYLNERFTKKAFLSVLKKKYTFIHVASHFRFSPGDESDSYLVLGNSSILPLSELKGFEDIFSGVECLALSACNTAAQQESSSGKEIDGFAELTQRLGAKAVIASLWTVADESTAKLMEIFYYEMSKGEGRKESSKAESLRQAQLALLRGEFNPERRIPANERFTKKQPFEVSMKSHRTDTRPRDAEFVKAPKNNLTSDIRENQFSHPYFWAPFVLFGNWL